MTTITWGGKVYEVKDRTNTVAAVVAHEVGRANANKHNLQSRLASYQRDLEMAAKALEADEQVVLYSSPASLDMIVAEYRQRCESLANLLHAAVETGVLAIAE